METFISTNTLSISLAVAALWVLYLIAYESYNISSKHPLHHVPGPKLAAMTVLYEFWYDMILGGGYTKRIKEMHETYGESMHPYSTHLKKHVDEIQQAHLYALVRMKYIATTLHL